jgi:hypothetical protein
VSSSSLVGDSAILVSSNDFHFDTVIVDLPSLDAGSNVTLQFYFQTDFFMTASNGATLVTNPAYVQVGQAGSTSTYTIHVQDTNNDSAHDYTVKLVVSPTGVASCGDGVTQCAASTRKLMQLSLPLALLFFIFGRTAAEI